MNNTTFVHKYIKPLIGKDDLVIDMTAGGGNDTLFLARYAGKVLAFDISSEAIERTKKKTEGYDNITYILDSHTRVDAYTDSARLVLFNLGYYPYGDKTSPTKAETTSEAFLKSWDLLEEGGYLVMTFYRGHQGGKEEYLCLLDLIKKKGLRITEAYRQHRHMDEPVTVILKKT